MDLSNLTSTSTPTPPSKESIKQQVTSELALANAQQLITKATEKCYLKCVPAPSTSLSAKEQTCLSRCMERYFEAFNVVSSTYVRRITAQAAGSPGAEAV